MIGHCAAILNCRQTQLPARYQFSGSIIPQPYHTHDHHDASSLSAGHHTEHDTTSAASSSHGIELPVVGGNSYVDPGTPNILAAAAIDPNTVVINVDGETYLHDMQNVDVRSLELACNDEGCALIPDDGNPYNDILVEGTV